MVVRVKKLTEAEFTRQVIQLAKLRGWRVAHFRPARTKDGWRTAVSGDGVGFPDLILVRGSELLAAELKVGKRKPTAEQYEWMNAFREAGVRSMIWRPQYWEFIEKQLS